jgi:hypothetical protein
MFLSALAGVLLMAQVQAGSYESVEGAFRVAFPGNPEVLHQSVPGPGGKRLPSLYVHLKHGNRLYMVTTFRTHAPLTFPASLDVLAAVASGFIANSRLIGASEDVEAGGLRGKQYTIQRMVLAIGQPS